MSATRIIPGEGAPSPPPPGTPRRKTEVNPRARLPGVRSRGLSDDLGVYPAISASTRRSRRLPGDLDARPDETPRTRTIVPGEKGSLKNALSGPAHAPRAPPDTALRLAHVEDRAYVMRAQRDRIHPGSRHASPARQNPPRRDSREPTSHNSSSGDMTNSTPPGAPSGGSAAGAAGTGRWPRRRRWGLAPPRGRPVVWFRRGVGVRGPPPAAPSGGSRAGIATSPPRGPSVAAREPRAWQSQHRRRSGTRPRFRNRSSCAAVV